MDNNNLPGGQLADLLLDLFYEEALAGLRMRLRRPSVVDTLIQVGLIKEYELDGGWPICLVLTDKGRKTAEMIISQRARLTIDSREIVTLLGMFRDGGKTCNYNSPPPEFLSLENKGLCKTCRYFSDYYFVITERGATLCRHIIYEADNFIRGEDVQKHSKEGT